MTKNYIQNDGEVSGAVLKGRAAEVTLCGS